MADLLAKVSYSRNSFSPLPSPTLGLPTTTGGRTVPVGKWKQRFMGIVARRKAMEYTVLAYLERMFARSDDARVQWLEGVAWAVAGGSLAGMCLVFTKGVVKIFWNPGHPLVHPSPLITLLLTIITAVLQIICLNKALKCADTVVVVPLFYAGYTVFGWVNGFRSLLTHQLCQLSHLLRPDGRVRHLGPRCGLPVHCCPHCWSRELQNPYKC